MNTKTKIIATAALTVVLLVAFSSVPSSDSDVNNTTIDFGTFLKNVIKNESGDYSYDGNGITVEWSPSSACTNNTHTVETCPDKLESPDGNNPQRFQEQNVQYQIFKDGSNVTIKNVTFKFIPASFTICSNSDWKGSVTVDEKQNAELQLLNSGNIVFENCNFDKVIVSPYEKGGSTVTGMSSSFTSCTFSNNYNTYDIKDVYTENLTVNGCTFSNGSGGIYLEGNVAKGTIQITNNKFIGMDRNCEDGKLNGRGLIQISSNGNYSDSTKTKITITGNTSDNDAPVLRQLNKTLTDDVLSVSQILDENTFGGDVFVYKAVYYDKSAESNGNGAKESPYNSFEGAMSAIPMGGTIIIVSDPDYTLTGITKSVTLTTENGLVPVKGGISISSDIGYLRIKNLEFTGTSSIGWYKDAKVASNIIIDNCKFDQAGGNCVYIVPQINSLEIIDSTFIAISGEEYEKQFLIWPSACEEITIENNTFTGSNIIRGVVHFGDGHSDGTAAYVKDNTFSNFERAFQVAFTNEGKQNALVIKNNTFTDIALKAGTTCKSDEYGVMFIHENLVSGTAATFSNNTYSNCNQVFYSENKTLTAGDIVLLNIDFNNNGRGAAVASQIVKFGSTLTKPSDPSATNYVFGGWYTDAGFTSAYDFSAVVTHDLTLYAKWTYSEPVHVHSWGSGRVVKEATCGTSGTIVYTCSCGATTTGTIPATGNHSWDSGTVTTEATETSTGVKTYTCTSCGQTKTETIPKLTCTHSWDSGTVTQEATCGAAGSKTFTCTKCGQTKTESVPATGNHSWDSGTIVKEPTTTESGITEYHCSVCGQTKTATIEPKKTETKEEDGVKTTTDTTKTVETGEDGSETVTETTTVSKEENGKVVEKVETTTSTTQKDGTTIVAETTVTEKDGSTEKVEITKSTTETEDTVTVAESTVKEKDGQLVEKVETTISTTQTEDTTIVSETKVTEKAGEATEKVETTTSTTQKEGATLVAETKVTEKGQEKTEATTVSVESDDGQVKTEVAITDGSTSGIKTVISGEVNEDTITHAIKQADMASEAVSDKVSDVSKDISVPNDNVTLSPTSLSALADSGTSLTITGDAGSVGIDSNVAGSLMSHDEDVTVSISEKKEGLTEAQKAKAGDSKVIELSAKSATQDFHELGGKAVVRIDISSMDYKNPEVYWLKDDGTAEKVDAEIGGGYAAIELDHFSLYYVAEGASSESSNLALYIVAAVIVIAVIAAAGYMVRKKNSA